MERKNKQKVIGVKTMIKTLRISLYKGKSFLVKSCMMFALRRTANTNTIKTYDRKLVVQRFENQNKLGTKTM